MLRVMAPSRGIVSLAAAWRESVGMLRVIAPWREIVGLMAARPAISRFRVRHMVERVTEVTDVSVSRV